MPEHKIESAIKSLAPLRPAKLIGHLDLKRPIYQKTASYGHFGRKDADFSWERLDLADKLKG